MSVGDARGFLSFRRCHNRARLPGLHGPSSFLTTVRGPYTERERPVQRAPVSRCTGRRRGRFHRNNNDDICAYCVPVPVYIRA